MLLNKRRKKYGGQSRTQLRPASRTRRLALEALEEKRMLTTLTVTSLLDDTLANLAGDGELSLREAIEAANLDTSVDGSPTGSGADTIEFAPGLAGGTISLSGTQLKLTDDLTITGLGSDELTVSGNNASRIFGIESGITVNIAGLMIADGYAFEGGAIYNDGLLNVEDSEFSGNSSFNDGGGIWNGGTLDIINSAFSNNKTTGDQLSSAPWGGRSGGAIWNGGVLDISNGSFLGNSSIGQGGGIHSVGGTVTIADSVFEGNSATGSGATGGAFSSFIHVGGAEGTLEITNSVFSENSSGSGGAIWSDMPTNISDSTFSSNTARGFGGAISHRVATTTITRTSLVDNSSNFYGGAIDAFGGTLILRDSTVSGNSARLDGGAIENSSSVRLFNSTISGNSAGRLGGAIDNWRGTFESTNSTIVMNLADSDGDGSGTGGGIYNLNASSVALLNNTILAGNLLGAAGDDSPNDLAGVNADPASSHNLIGDANTSGGLTDGDNGNIVGDNGGSIDIATVLIPSLANNGGPTLTHALRAVSLAVDSGDNSLAVDANGVPLEYDQRGAGYARVQNGTVNIGAVEASPPPRVVHIDIKPGSDPNLTNLASDGVISVAIVTTSDFDASLVNGSAVVFAGANAVHSGLEDVDGDGDLDMVVQFRVQDTILANIYAELLSDDIDQDGVLDSNRQAVTVTLGGLTMTDEYFTGFDEMDLFLSGKNLRELLEDLAAAGTI